MALPSPAFAAAVTKSEQQGLTQWNAFNGKLTLVAGTVLDIIHYKRSMTFYFEEKPGEDWHHVPIVESKVDNTLTWFSASSGEITLADAIVSARPNGIYLIKAVKHANNGAYEKGKISVTWFKLLKADEDDSDSPRYSFKIISTAAYPENANLSVEEALKKEAALKPKK